RLRPRLGLRVLRLLRLVLFLTRLRLLRLRLTLLSLALRVLRLRLLRLRALDLALRLLRALLPARGTGGRERPRGRARCEANQCPHLRTPLAVCPRNNA